MHLAFILDGNRRYAKKAGIPAIEGHRKGLLAVRDQIIEACLEQGVSVLSLYCFSTENWSRSRAEVSALMRLFEEVVQSDMQKFVEKGVQVRHIGRKDRLPASLISKIKEAETMLPEQRKLIVNLALDYGSQDEIVRAMQKVPPSEIPSVTPEKLTPYLDTGDLPPVDLLIRTGGDLRISNFLLWQCAYAELKFLDQFLPELTKEDVVNCIQEFRERERRYGN